MKVVVLFVLSVNLVSSKVYLDKEYEDIYLNVLLDDDDSVGEQYISKDTESVNESKPTFEDGLWKCGKCDDVDEMQLVYTERNDVDILREKHRFDMLVQLDIPDARCVTITGDKMAEITVQRVSGACSSSNVILRVKPRYTQKDDHLVNARYDQNFSFFVNVYGY